MRRQPKLDFNAGDCSPRVYRYLTGVTLAALILTSICFYIPSTFSAGGMLKACAIGGIELAILVAVFGARRSFKG